MSTQQQGFCKNEVSVPYQSVNFLLLLIVVLCSVLCGLLNVSSGPEPSHVLLVCD
jgi:cytochrome c biogenesis factor